MEGWFYRNVSNITKTWWNICSPNYLPTSYDLPTPHHHHITPHHTTPHHTKHNILSSRWLSLGGREHIGRDICQSMVSHAVFIQLPPRIRVAGVGHIFCGGPGLPHDAGSLHPPHCTRYPSISPPPSHLFTPCHIRCIIGIVLHGYHEVPFDSTRKIAPKRHTRFDRERCWFVAWTQWGIKKLPYPTNDSTLQENGGTTKLFLVLSKNRELGGAERKGQIPFPFVLVKMFDDTLKGSLLQEMETDREVARAAVDTYVEAVPKERPSGWFAPIISSIGFPERVSPAVCDFDSFNSIRS